MIINAKHTKKWMEKRAPSTRFSFSTFCFCFVSPLFISRDDCPCPLSIVHLSVHSLKWNVNEIHTNCRCEINRNVEVVPSLSSHISIPSAYWNDMIIINLGKFIRSASSIRIKLCVCVVDDWIQWLSSTILNELNNYFTAFGWHFMVVCACVYVVSTIRWRFLLSNGNMFYHNCHSCPGPRPIIVHWYDVWVLGHKWGANAIS